ncbi:hypothetical protein [Tropicimonas sp. S265A]|uniref:hypothetical protein n=1 Tax=Tropicimonas sp. S265A TaxID=3415134 RepID=UPI003C7A414F
MTAVATNLDLPVKAKKVAVNRGKFDASVSKDELKFAALAAVILTLWIGATVLFGYAGLITGALSMVATMYMMIVVISRG